jgi:hypothetical protein
MRKTSFLALAAVMLVMAACLTPKRTQPVVFTAMGCGPYSEAAETALERFIRLENQIATSSFMIHCGDIVTGRNKRWPESQYEKVAGILTKGNQIPTFIVPGDNEWNDQDDPDQGWAFWSRHFLRFDMKWTPPGLVERQNGRPENFAFIKDRVLFVGINKVGGLVHDADEWQKRLADNGRWVAELFAKYSDKVHSAAIFAQARASGAVKPVNLNGFAESLKQSAIKFGKPVLYLHADGHKWYVIEGDWAPNITHVQLDLISSDFPPIQVTVTGDPERPFVFDRRQDNARWGTVKSGVESK